MTSTWALDKRGTRLNRGTVARLVAMSASIGCTRAQAVEPRQTGPAQAVRSSSTVATESIARPRNPSAPPCGADGPILDVTVLPSAHGMPPHRRAIVDVHVRNASTASIWLLYDMGGGLPTIITEVTVSRTSPATGAYVWSFAGDGAFDAVRVPPGADVMLRGLELSAYSGDEPLLLAVAGALLLGDRAADVWVGRAGLLPTRGDFALTDLVPQIERKVDDETQRTPIHVRVLCVRSVDPSTMVTR